MSSIVTDFIDAVIMAPTASHAFRQVQLFRALLPAFLEHCGPDRALLSDAEWQALLEFLCLLAAQPGKDAAAEAAGNFGGTLLEQRFRRLSAIEATACVTELLATAHRSRHRVYTLLQGRAAEQVAELLERENELTAVRRTGSSVATALGSSRSAASTSSSVVAAGGGGAGTATTTGAADGTLSRGISDVAGRISHTMHGPALSNTPADMNMNRRASNVSWPGDSVVAASSGFPPAPAGAHSESGSAPATSSSACSDDDDGDEDDDDDDGGKKKQQPQRSSAEQTLEEVQACEHETEQMLLAASGKQAQPPVTIAGATSMSGAAGGSLDLWFFTLDCVPPALLGSITEADFVATEAWFNALPRAPPAAVANNAAAGGGGGGSAAETVAQQQAMVTDGLLRGVPAVGCPPLCVGARYLGPRVYDAGGGLARFDTKLLDDWIAYFPRGTGSLVDVLCFLYRDAPRLFLQRRVEGQCLAVPPSHDAWPADTFCCGQLVVPVQRFPPPSSSPVLQLSHVVKGEPASFLPNSGNNAGGGGGTTTTTTRSSGGIVTAMHLGAFRPPPAHSAALSVATMLHVGVTPTNRGAFLSALRQWFDAVDFYGLGFVTFRGMQRAMALRFREPPLELPPQKGLHDEIERLANGGSNNSNNNNAMVGTPIRALRSPGATLLSPSAQQLTSGAITSPVAGAAGSAVSASRRLAAYNSTSGAFSALEAGEGDLGRDDTHGGADDAKRQGEEGPAEETEEEEGREEEEQDPPNDFERPFREVIERAHAAAAELEARPALAAEPLVKIGGVDLKAVFLIAAGPKSWAASSSVTVTAAKRVGAFCMAMLHASAAAEAAIQQSGDPELPRPVTCDSFARAFVRVAGLDGAVAHPAVLADVSNAAVLRMLERRGAKRALDERHAGLAQQLAAAASAAAGKDAKGSGGKRSAAAGGAGANARGGGVGARGGAAASGGGADGASSAAGPASLGLSFAINADQRARLRKRIDNCLAAAYGASLLQVATNVRAHRRIQQRKQDAEAVDRSNNNNATTTTMRVQMLGRRRSSLASLDPLALIKRRQRDQLRALRRVAPLYRIDGFFDPACARDAILLHIDAAGLPLEYFVERPHAVYRRLPFLLSAHARVYRDAGYWSSMRRRLTLEEERANAAGSSKCTALISATSYATLGSGAAAAAGRAGGDLSAMAGGGGGTFAPRQEVVVMRTNIPAGRDVSFRFHFEGYNDAMGCAINTIVCGREGREGNVLVSGVDGVTTDVDAERTRSLSVRHLAPGIGRVTARLDNATKLLVLELHAGERGSWAVAGFSVSVAVVSPEYGAGFVCAVSFETKTIAHPSAAASGSQAQ